MYMQSYKEVMNALVEERIPFISTPDYINFFDEDDQYSMYFSSGCRQELRFLEFGKNMTVYVDRVEIEASDECECNPRRILKFFNGDVEVASTFVDYFGRTCEECSEYDECDFEGKEDGI